jgi:ureidoacrylate peracid hydrolase
MSMDPKSTAVVLIEYQNDFTSDGGVLHSKGITTIALGGFLTNCCVESTMRTGYEHGYQVITLSDCLAATSVEEHENALKYDFPMFSKPMASADFIAELGG